MRVALLLKEYPEVTLTTEDQTTLKDPKAQIKPIANSGNSLPTGNAPCRMWQSTDSAVANSGGVVLKLEKWKGVEVVAYSGDDIPNTHVDAIFFPKSAAQDTKKLLTMLVQSEGLCTQKWKILLNKEDGKGLMNIGIDIG